MQKLNLEWKIVDKDHVALIFDKPTFKAFQDIATSRGLDTTDMIAQAVSELLGPVLVTRVEG